ncbi:MAG: nucleoside hydrolase [Clostridia bacterium]|nr:nucleoside hydrolase [Clostridia bacterium]
MKYEPLYVSGGSVILDTDIGPDCDDAGAIAILGLLSRNMGFKVDALINCTSNHFGNGAADALLRYAGLFGVAEGRFCRRSFLEDTKKYNEYVANTYSEAFRKGSLKVEDSLELYRRVLENADPGSVTVITIGQFNALAEIFEAEPELCREKLRAVISMAGSVKEDVAEYNVVCDVPAAQTVAVKTRELGIPFILSPFEVGADVITGFSPDDRAEDPLRDSYRLYTDGGMKRNSWDLTAVLFAAEGENAYFGFSGAYSLDIRDDGTMSLASCEKGNVGVISLLSGTAELEEYLEKLMKESFCGEMCL